MNEGKFNYISPNNRCKFELSWENGTGWYQVEMYINATEETHLGRLRIICEENEVTNIEFIGDFIRIKVIIYKWAGKWYFQYRLPDPGSLDGMNCLVPYLDDLQVEVVLLQDLENDVRQLVSE